MRWKRLATEFTGDSITCLRPGIDDRYKLTRARGGIFLGVESSEIPDPYHRHSDFGHGWDNIRSMQNPLSPLLLKYRSLNPMGQRLWWLGGAVFCGLTLVPVAIFAAGRGTLGEYSNGGLFALWGDYFRGLADFNLAYWFAAAGPLLVLFVFEFWRKTITKALP